MVVSNFGGWVVPRSVVGNHHRRFQDERRPAHQRAGFPSAMDPRQLYINHHDSSLLADAWNSTVIATFTVVLTLLVSSLAAYTLAHIRFAGRKWIANYLTLGLTFPFATAVLPVFIRVRDLGLLDTYWGVILPQVAFNLSFSIVLLRSFFAELPRELFEAAIMDGCSYPRIFLRITLPLSRPILATVAVLALVGSWNNYLLPLVTINDDSVYPWPLGIMQFQGQYSTDWGKVLAFVSLTMVPAITLYLLAQKQIIAGLTSGAVKG